MTKVITVNFQRLPTLAVIASLFNLGLPSETVLTQCYSFTLVSSKEVGSSVVGLKIHDCLLGASRVLLVQRVLCYLRY